MIQLWHMEMELKKFVVAVSGGVDSVTLLDMLANNRLKGFSKSQLVIAHLDHGIREESLKDAAFVKSLAEKYQLPFEVQQAELGNNASETTAREVRYKFLRQVCKKHKSSAIITAHHQDDVIETAIMNLLRGTSWRGLSSLRKTSTLKSQTTKDEYEITRPLLGKTKQELLTYAKEQGLEWREDVTNQDQSYQRNYVRQTLLPKAKKRDSVFNKKMLKHIEVAEVLREQIEAELEMVVSGCEVAANGYEVSRHLLVMWPDIVAKEVIYALTTRLDPNWHPTEPQIKRILHFCKTAEVGKTIEISSTLHVGAEKSMLHFRAGK